MLKDIEILGQLGDMKEVDYRNTLAIASIIEILLEKKIISHEDLSKKAQELENLAFLEAGRSPLAKI